MKKIPLHDTLIYIFREHNPPIIHRHISHYAVSAFNYDLFNHRSHIQTDERQTDSKRYHNTTILPPPTSRSMPQQWTIWQDTRHKISAQYPKHNLMRILEADSLVYFGFSAMIVLFWLSKWNNAMKAVEREGAHRGSRGIFWSWESPQPTNHETEVVAKCRLKMITLTNLVTDIQPFILCRMQCHSPEVRVGESRVICESNVTSKLTDASGWQHQTFQTTSLEVMSRSIWKHKMRYNLTEKIDLALQAVRLLFASG